MKNLDLISPQDFHAIPPNADEQVTKAIFDLANCKVPKRAPKKGRKRARRPPCTSPGATARGVPADYAGDDPSLCNARTKTGQPCRALGLPGSGRCKWHGGLSTGPRTAEGKAESAKNLRIMRSLQFRASYALKRMGKMPAD